MVSASGMAVVVVAVVVSSEEDIEAGSAAASVMGVSGESFAGSGGAGAWSVDRHMALFMEYQCVGEETMKYRFTNVPFSLQYGSRFYIRFSPLFIFNIIAGSRRYLCNL